MCKWRVCAHVCLRKRVTVCPCVTVFVPVGLSVGARVCEGVCVVSVREFGCCVCLWSCARESVPVCARVPYCASLCAPARVSAWPQHLCTRGCACQRVCCGGVCTVAARGRVSVRGCGCVSPSSLRVGVCPLSLRVAGACAPPPAPRRSLAPGRRALSKVLKPRAGPRRRRNLPPSVLARSPPAPAAPRSTGCLPRAPPRSPCSSSRQLSAGSGSVAVPELRGGTSPEGAIGASAAEHGCFNRAWKMSARGRCGQLERAQEVPGGPEGKGRCLLRNCHPAPPGVALHSSHGPTWQIQSYYAIKASTAGVNKIDFN